jgi:regulator of RNase E activity RraA
MVVADEEGIVVVPSARRQQTLVAAQGAMAKEADESLDMWEQAHRARINTILSENGFEG